MPNGIKKAVESGRTCKDFRKCSIEQEVFREVFHRSVGFHILFHDGKNGSVKEVFHDGIEFLVIQFVNGREPFCENFAVRTVGTERQIVDIQAVRLPDSGSFLTDGKMSRTGVVICHSVVFRLYFDFIQHGFEFPDRSHIMINPEEISLIVKLFFLGEGLGVLTDRDILEMNETGDKGLCRIDELRLWHKRNHSLSVIAYYRSRFTQKENVASRITSQTVGWGNTNF